jgi:RNA polymerase sigma-70 factor (ECF subfamily)
MTDDKGSFRQIYERYYPGILRFLIRLVGEDEAEDVAQEVFLRVDRGLPAFRGEAAIGTWIYTIARNAALDRLRARPRWDRNAGEIEAQRTDDAMADLCSSLPDEQASVERYLIGKEMSECIRWRVESLPESYRSVLVLSELAGMTNAEIASALGTSEGVVKIRLHRARAMLRNELGTHCTLYRDERDELACEPRPAFLRF